MSSTFGGLNTLVRALYTQQTALNTVGHNIANASTPGYSRQQVNIATTQPETIYGGVGPMQVGTGVQVNSIVRARDFFVDQQYWRENSSLGYGEASQDSLRQIEAIFTDDLTAGTGIQTVLNNFWNAWQTLSTNSSNPSAQTAVRERGADLADALQHAAEQLKSIVANVNANLSTNVAKINQISSEIFSLNKQISNIEVGGIDHANDLRDKRDLLVDELSKLAGVRVTEDQGHNYSIQIADVTIVDGSGTMQLAVQSSTDPTYGFEVKNVIVAGNSNWNVNFTGGEMKALQETNTTIAQNYLNKLSTMSQFLLQEFNAVHRAGFGSDNSTGVNFFGDPAVDYNATPITSAGGWLNALKVNPDLYNADGLNKIAIKTAKVDSVVGSNSAGGRATVTGTYIPPNESYQSFIVRVASTDAAGQVTGIQYSLDGGSTYSATVAGTGTFTLPYGLSISIIDSTNNAANDTYRFSVPQGNSSGDNATNLANSIKQPTNMSASVLKGASLDDFYASLVANLGIEAQNSESLTDNQQTLIDQITNWRESTSGVSIDEEMANMIRFQKGYQSAARVITAIDEILDKLINGTGVVGR